MSDQIEYMLVRRLASLFPSNQVAARRGIVEVMARSPTRAVEALYRVLVEESAGPGEPFVVNLLVADETRLMPLINSPMFDIPTAVRVLRRLIQADAGVEAALLRLAVRERDPEAVLRALNILEETGDCMRVSRELQLLMRQQNPHVRAKAARLVMRVSRERERLLQLFSDPDQRVRANAAEGLFSLSLSDAEVEALWKLAEDVHHRPATTALAVLAMHGDQRASDKLIEAVNASNEHFQLAAAWAMGRVKDPAFLPVLQRVIRQQSGSLKRMAIRSCTLIRKHSTQPAVSASPQAENQPSVPD